MDSFLLIHKPVALTSAACVAQVKRALGVKKIGHTGTLDPFAEGLLPLAIGKATKVIEYLPKSRKHYRATLRLGEETATLDPEGEVTVHLPVPPLSEDRIAAVLTTLVGPQMQTPPIYSAVKIGGKALYRYARQGLEVPAPAPRPIRIEALTLLDWSPPHLSFDVVCSPGTYVRVLGQDIARALGSCGHLTALFRLASDGFSLDHALRLETLTTSSGADYSPATVSIATALAHLPELSLHCETELEALRHGKKNLFSLDRLFAATVPLPGDAVLTTWQSEAVAILQVTPEAGLRIAKVI